jgi:hypothetical protein
LRKLGYHQDNRPQIRPGIPGRCHLSSAEK